MKKKLSIFFRHNWGLFILVLVLVFLGLINLNTSIWLVGWDNFSTSLDLDLNFFRTLSTWRDYRGLGVASDSEMVDIFRQIILAVLNIFLPSNLVEQIYYLLLLAVGSIGIYYLSRKILSNGYRKDSSGWLLQLAGLFSAIYYIFNLHTLETFLFPMAMYTARYAFFPWIIYNFTLFYRQKSLSKKTLVGFIISSLLVSTSYLTATIFFTLMMVLAVVILRFDKLISKYIIPLLLFLALNLFWLLPFTNYYFNKSHLLPTASSFIEVNESLLNKPRSDYSWLKIFTFYPQTLSSDALPYKSIDTGEPRAVHELAQPFTNLSPWSKIGLILPLFFVLSGAIAILLRLFKKKYQDSWVLFVALIALVFLRKDLPPVGFIYEGLSKYIPFFEVVFRFSGSKFYPILLLSFALLLGVGALVVFDKLFSLFKNKVFIRKIFPALLLLIIILPFKSFFTGNFFSQLVKTEIPVAYFSMANHLNKKENGGRVLHLPYDQFSYWKSYQWGYMGSSFLNFMLESPLLDRTFEPASPELDRYFITLNDLANGIVDVSEVEQLRRVKLITSLLSRTNTRYLLLDESVSPKLTEKNLNAWGVFHEDDWRAILSILENQEKIFIVKNELIEISDGEAFNLSLYEIEKEDFDRNLVLSVDPNLDNTFIDPLLNNNQIFIQSENQYSFVTYPFWQPKKDLSYNSNFTNLSASFPHGEQIKWFIDQEELTSSSDRVYDIFVSLSNENLEVFLQQNLVPLTNSKLTKFSEKVIFSTYRSSQDSGESKNYVNNWHRLSFNPSQFYRLKIDETLFPLPQKIDEQPTYLASLLLSDQDVSLQLLEMYSSKAIPSERFSLTDNPNCFEDKKENYNYEFDNSSQEVALTTRGGMTCITTPLIIDDKGSTDFHYELTVDIQGNSKAVKDRENLLESKNTFESKLEEVVLSQASYLTTQGCLLNSVTGECLNSRDLVVVGEQRRVTLVADKFVDSAGVAALFILPAKEHDKNSMIIKNSVFNVFSPIERKRVKLSSVIDSSEVIEVAGGEKINLQLPHIYSSDTIYINPQVEGLTYYNSLCEKGDGLRKVVATPQIPVLSYLNNCFQSLGSSLDIFGSRSYLWELKYKLLLGRQPRFVAKHNGKSVSNEFLSRFYLYPANTQDKLDKNLTSGWLLDNNFQSAHKILPPMDSSNLISKMEFEIQQLVDGQGLVAINSMNIMAMPGYWQNLAVSNGEFELKLDQIQVLSAEKVWPSLWRLKLNVSQLSTDKALLIFDQAYDQQWHVFKTSSWIDALWGRSKLSADQVKVNGWSNGWLVAVDDISAETEILIFYTPERLTVLGWVLGIITTIVLFRKISLRGGQRKLRSHFLKKQVKNFLRGFN